ncbi:MAG: HipA domain-containing protein [Acidimicrobiales bacterium]
MPSDTVFVWGWLLGRTEPVPFGVLTENGGIVGFSYAQSYLARSDAVPLYDIPLGTGLRGPPAGMNVHGCFSDVAPDAWGRRVILHRLTGRSGRDAETADLSLLTYLLESASYRAGALDFQSSPTKYEPRGSSASLEEMMSAADRLQAGEALSPSLEAALLHGTSIGGARPKAALEDNGRHLIAKFESSSDPYPVVKAEGAAMTLAAYAGVEVPAVKVVECLGKSVLLVERFDRTADGGRRMMVSALTVLRLPEELAHYASYVDLADQLRSRAADPKADLRQLFSRVTFNIMVSNTDDHAKNHAAFWDGKSLSLTPAYDICPQLRSGGEQAQAMAIDRDGWRFSQLEGCVRAAPNYLLDETEARGLIDYQLEVVRSHWEEAADIARLTGAERRRLWGRQIMNPYCLEGYQPAPRRLVGTRPGASSDEVPRCARCHRPLRSAESISRGMGPKCAEQR